MLHAALVWTLVAGLLAAMLFVAHRIRHALRPPPRVPLRPAVTTDSQGKKKRVAVIGAGSSGIAAAKCAMEEGFDVVTFEQTDSIGGNWVFREHESHSSVYRTTSINTSKDMMSFADFPMPKHLAPFPERDELCQYFESYADHFGVRKTILFNTKVLHARPRNEDRQWEITHQTNDDEPRTEVFDFVMVANGHHWNPRWPSFENMDTFTATQQHSHTYKDPYPFKDKVVVLVGIGNSAVDVATEVSRWAKSVYLVTRRGAWVLPKYVFGKPIDHTVSRLQQLMPAFLFNRMTKLLIKLTHGDMEKWGLKPKFDPLSSHPTVSSDFLPRIGTGKVIVKPNIKRLVPRSDVVEFEDNTSVRCDNIIYATGYKVSFPFFDDDMKLVDEETNRVSFYKLVFPPNHSNLAFIGLIQPLGAIFPIAEMQSRWVVKVFSGAVPLPAADAMWRDIRAREKAMALRYTASPRHTIQVDYLPYMDELADEIGVRPNVWGHPGLVGALLLGPTTPIQYRLEGPGAWAGAREEIRSKYNDEKRNLLNTFHLGRHA